MGCHVKKLRGSRSLESKFWPKVCCYPGDCWEWMGARIVAGYGILYHDGRSVYAHRVSYELHKGLIPDGRFICHRCDRPSCVNPQHLYAGTAQDNARDMAGRGRQHVVRLPGERNPSAKLTAEVAQRIRETPGKQRDVARQFGVSQHTVWAIRTGKRWTR